MSLTGTPHLQRLERNVVISCSLWFRRRCRPWLDLTRSRRFLFLRLAEELHATRHYAITRIAERIGNPLIVKALAGHRSPSTTQRYAHPSDDALEDGVEGALGGNRFVRKASVIGVPGNRGVERWGRLTLPNGHSGRIDPQATRGEVLEWLNRAAC